MLVANNKHLFEMSEGLLYSKLHSIHRSLVTLTLAIAAGLAAPGLSAQTPAAPQQVQTPAQSAQAPAATASTAPVGTGTLRGHIVDPTGALIPGATVNITTSAGTAVTSTTADSAGAYSVTGLAPGGYIIQATFEGFAPFGSPTIQLAAGQSKRVDISMAIEVAQQNVVVTDDTPQVSTDAGSNASAIVLKGKDLDALSDDPDELSSELTALAGPAAGPNGGQIYIDGFTGGQLPPKSAIREIRINQNPFSAEYDQLGYGRIEILTKPGTDKLHGRAFLQGNDDVFNTGNPFTTVIPAYHSIQGNGTVNGALSKTSSFFVSVEQRNNQNASIYTADTAILDPTTGLYSAGIVSGGLFNPQTRTNISPRIDLQLGQKNTLTARYQFYRNNVSGQIGSTALPSQSYAETSIENTVQLSDSQIISDHIVNETRFQYLRDTTNEIPVSSAPSVTVPGSFTSGGVASQTSHDHQDHLELQNLTTMSIGAQAIKFGTRLRDNRDANSTNAGFNGSFNFPSVPGYLATLNGLANHETFAQIAADCTVQGGCLPNKLNYATGPLGATANVFDAAVFLQDDWKVNRNLTISGGLRWEGQNHVADHDDWGPRAAFAYALDGHKDKKQAKTVVRGGYGFFYTRFSLANELQAERFSGAPNTQQQVAIDSPTCFNATSLSDIDLSTCGSAASNTSTVVLVSPRYRSPVTEQFGASLERQLTKTTTLTATYLHSYGVHQNATRDSNAFLPGTFEYGSTTLTGVRPDPSLGITNEYFPEAVFKQNQVIVNLNARITPTFSVLGFYNFTVANSDTGTAANSYDLMQGYGRAPFAARNMVFLMGNYTAKWGITFNPFLIANAGRPFNITTGYDLTGDNFFNDRPSYATSASDPANVVDTSYGALDTIPEPGEKIIPANMGNGPAGVAVNLRVSRTWGIGPKLTSANAGQNQNGGPPPGGGPPGGGGGRGGPGGGGGGGMGGGFGPGGFGGGGGRGPGGFGGASTNRKYSLNFSAQALNLFNDIDYGTPTGTVIPGSDRFGKSTSLAQGIFSSGAAARRIFFQAAFSF